MIYQYATTEVEETVIW